MSILNSLPNEREDNYSVAFLTLIKKNHSIFMRNRNPILHGTLNFFLYAGMLVESFIITVFQKKKLILP